jgi:hypothetical protein
MRLKPPQNRSLASVPFHVVDKPTTWTTTLRGRQGEALGYVNA